MEEVDEDEALAKAVAASLQDSVQNVSFVCICSNRDSYDKFIEKWSEKRTVIK